MADPQQETFTDVQPIQQKTAPAADASAPQETFTDVTPIAVSKTPKAPAPKSTLGQMSEAPGLTDEEKVGVGVARAARGAYHGIMGDEETPESKGETTTASPEAAKLGFTPEHLGYKAGEMVHGIGKFGADVAKDVMGNTPIAVPNEQGVGISDPKAHTLLAKYITAPSQAERDASQNEMQKYFESQGPEAAGHAISSFLHGTLGEYVPLVGPLAMSLTDQAAKGDIGGALAQLAALYGFEKGTGAVKEGIKGRVQDAVANATKTPEIRQAEANVKALEADRAAAQAAYDKALAEHNKHAASHAKGIQSPEKVVKELTKTQAALDEATAHHELAKEALASKVAAQPTIPQRIGTAAGKAAASVLPTPVPAPEVPTEAIEAQPSPLKPLGTPEPAPALPAINVKTPGQIQPETFPQTPTEQPRTPLGRIELAGGQGTMGKPPLLTEGTPEGPQLPPGGLPQIKMPEAPKPAPQPAAVDEAALRALSAKEGKVVETPEKKVGRLLQEALKPTEKTKEATASETKETPEEYKGEERRENARPALMTPTEIEEAMKNHKPVHTPFDVTQGTMDTIKRDKDLPKSPAEEFSEKTAVPNKMSEAGPKNTDRFPAMSDRLSKFRESQAVPKSESTGYKAKNEEVVPTGAEGREAAKSAEEYHPAVEQKVNELSDENLKKLAKAHGLNPDEYDFNARDERRHRVERDQLAKDIVAQMGEDEKINIGRAAESAERREPGFASRDTTAQSKAARAEKIFPRLRGPVDEYGNPTIRGGAPSKAEDAIREIENKFPVNPEKEGAGTEPKELALMKDDKPEATFTVSERDGKLRLKGIQSMNPKTGAGTRALKSITDIADKHGLTVELTASPYGDEATRLNSDQLKNWYSRNGFVHEPGSDPALGYMVREPKTPEAKTAAKYANPEKGIPETSLAKGPEAEAMHAATVASDKLAKSWETPDKESGTAKKPVDLKKVVGDYAKREGLGEVKDNNMEVDPRSKEIARAYDDMKHNPSDPEVKKSYDALIDDAKKQWDTLKKAGIKIEPQDTDPYKTYDEMKKDFEDNNRIKVWRGGNPLPEDHPLAKVDPKTGETYNTMFRAVHDTIGHLLHDNDFSDKGEQNAFDTHRQTLSEEAKPAMTTETKGQVAWVMNHGGSFEGMKQKAGILPERFNEDAPDSKAILDHLKSGKDFALLTAENPNNTRATEAQNATKNREMKAELEKMGYKPVSVEGHVKDVEGQKENSFYVPDITPEDAAKVSKKFGQASVMTKQGIHDLVKNTVHPSTGVMEGSEAAKQDYHSTVAGKPFSIGVDFDKEVPVGKNNYHGEPLSYEYDNGDHKVVTTDKDGKKIGELLAKDIAPNTVEVVSNQVYDKDLRGKGRGVDQIQHLLEKVGDDIKSVKSDISTSKDARAAWDKLEKFAPEAVTKETFKDGQVQYSVDMDKWRGEHSPQSVGSARAGTSLAKESPLTAKQLQERLPDLAQKHLTPEEKESITTTATGKPRSAGTAKFVQNMTNIPSVQEYTDIALAGEGARKWYSRSTAAFDAMHEEAPDYFKEGDKDKFMGVLAGSSPQQSVAMNLREALGFWKEWNDAGRPVPTLDKWKQFGEEADKAWKEDGSPRSKGLKTGASMHWDYAPQGPEWKTENLFVKNLTLPDTKMPNIIKALRGEDMWPDLTKNAAFKAPSFAENLRKWINGKSTGTKYVTNDSWMGLFGGIDKSALSKPENYHPLSVATRAAAEELGWEPEEAQAAIWSFTQALTEKGEEDPEIIRQYSEDFKDLLANDEQTRSKLEDLGVNLDQLDKKLEAIGEKPEISGRSTATTSRSVEQLKQRIEEARGKGAIPPAKSAQGELGFREPHPTRTPVDEAVGFDPEKFRTQTDEPLTKLGEKKKKSPFGTIR